MKPTHFVVVTGHSTKTTNKLQKEFKEFLRSLDGHLYPAEQLDKLRSKILAEAMQLNHKHPRCKQLAVSFEKHHNDPGFRISGFYFIVFMINAAYLQSE